jgi:hypothetical protein
MICVEGDPVRGRGFEAAVAKARKAKRPWRARLRPGKGVSASITIEGTGELPDGAELIAVLFQEQAETRCTAGENKGRTLAEFFVVRARSKPLDLDAARTKGATATFDAPEGVKRGNLGIAFLLEDRKGMRPIASWWTPLRKKEKTGERAGPAKPDGKGSGKDGTKDDPEKGKRGARAD